MSAAPLVSSSTGVDPHCSQIFFNALEIIHRPSDLDVLSLLHNLGQTTRCDKVADLSALRAAYTKKMGADVFDKAIHIDAEPLTEQEYRLVFSLFLD